MLNTLNNLPTLYLVLAIVALGVCLLGVFFASFHIRRRRLENTTQRQERKLKEHVARKASDTGRWMAEPEEDLTDSGVSSVLEMMESLMRQGNLNMAEKWALNAIRNHTSNVEIPLRLAEMYFSEGRKARFVAISQYLESDKFNLTKAQSQHLKSMGTQIAPEHPLFSDEFVDCQAAC